MDCEAVGKLLSGLCQVGAWGCFDEFNRIDPSVLSVISSQIRSIQQALGSGRERFTVIFLIIIFLFLSKVTKLKVK